MQPAQHSGESVNWAGFLWLLVFIVPAVLWYLPKGIGGSTSSYSVKVRTVPAGLPFSGSYGVVSAEGGAEQKSVDGRGDTEYEVGRGQVSSVVFQKQTEYGTLTVELWRDGRLLKSTSTSAQYGVALLAD